MGSHRFVSRRTFVTGLAASSAAAILAACGGNDYPTPAPTAVGSATGASTGGNASTPATGATSGSNAPTTAPMTTGAMTPTAPAIAMGAGMSANIPTPRNQTMISEVVKMQIFDTFNPYIPNGEQSNCGLWQACREALIYFNSQKGEFIPWLATKWDYNSDFTQLTLALNAKAKWSDGQPFTADDVLFTIDMLRNNPNFTGSSTVTQFIDSASAMGPNAVVIKLKQPSPRFHYFLTSAVSSPNIRIAPKHIWEKQDPGTFKNNPPIYTGPYVLDRTIPQQFLYVWKKNPDYWNKDVLDPKPQYLVWQQAQPTDATVQEFQRGNIDAPVGGQGYTFDFLQQEAIKGSYKNLIQLQFLDPWPRAVFFNQDSPSGLFAKPEGRQAMTYLFNRDQIAKTIWQPASTAAKYPWAKYKSNDKWENPDIQKMYDLTYDPKKAEQLLDAIGATRMGDARALNGKPLNLTIHTQVAVGLAEYQIAQSLAAEAKKVGINMEVKSTVGTGFTDINQLGQWDLKSEWMSAGTGLDPNELYYTFEERFYKPVGERATLNNYGRIHGTPLNDLATKLDGVSPDDPKNKPLFDQALAAFFQTAPATPSIQTVYPLAFNTTYWTGWPTQDNLYNIPAQWWANFLFVIGNLKPTGK